MLEVRALVPSVVRVEPSVGQDFDGGHSFRAVGRQPTPARRRRRPVAESLEHLLDGVRRVELLDHVRRTIVVAESLSPAAARLIPPFAFSLRFGLRRRDATLLVGDRPLDQVAPDRRAVDLCARLEGRILRRDRRQVHRLRDLLRALVECPGALLVAEPAHHAAGEEHPPLDRQRIADRQHDAVSRLLDRVLDAVE